MIFSRINPAIERIVDHQKKYSISSNIPSSYYSNIFNLTNLTNSIITQAHRYAPNANEVIDALEEQEKLRTYLEMIMITGEQYYTLPEEIYFDSLHSIQIMLETLDSTDHRAGICWKKSLFHNHDFFELQYVYRGHCTITIAGKDVELSAGDICIYNLQTVHRIGISSEEDTVFYVLIKKELFQQTVFQLQHRNSLVNNFFLHSLYHIQAPEQHLIFHAQENSRCEMILQMMIEEAYQDRALSQVFLNSMLSGLFTELFHQYYDAICTLSCQGPGALNITQVIEYIAAHFSDITLEETAAHFGYTPRTMIRFLKKHTHSTFRSILQDLRLKRAAVLLWDDNKSIQDIALEIGYSNRSYFHKLFQAHYGVTPAEYRQTLKKSL